MDNRLLFYNIHKIFQDFKNMLPLPCLSGVKEISWKWLHIPLQKKSKKYL